MIRFLMNPNLPQGRVTSLICGGLNSELLDFFEKRGIEVLFTEENRCKDRAVSKHGDLSVLYIGDGRIIVEKGQAPLIAFLKAEGFSVIVTSDELCGAYPDDCILNHAIVGNRIIGRSDIFDETVKRCCKDFELISVKQGYSKCSVLVVDESSIITDDESIARNALKKGIDSLLISKGDIFLEGHSYGFIGGASGKLSRDEIIFFGDITKHTDYFLIRDFLLKRSMNIVSFDFPLTDFGGIIPIKEKIF